MSQDEMTTTRTRRTLDEVILHSLGRTGNVARAIEAGFVALRDDATLASGHREVLEEFADMISESTPSPVDGTGIGMRHVLWRDAMRALLRSLRPDPDRRFAVRLAASMTERQIDQFCQPLTRQQHDLLRRAMHEIEESGTGGEP